MTSPALFWLPAPDADWADRLRAIGAPAVTTWEALMALANHRLDGLMAIRLDRVLTGLSGAA